MRRRMFVTGAVGTFLLMGVPVLAQTLTVPESARGVLQEASWTTLLAFYLPRLIEAAKRCRVPQIADAARRVDHWAALSVAVVAALGIHWTFNVGETGWSFWIGGTDHTLGGFVAHAMSQFALQQYFYEHQQAALPHAN